MTFDLSGVVALLGSGVGVIVGATLMKARQDYHVEDDAKQFKAIREWQDEHHHDAENRRIMYDQRLHQLELADAKISQQNQEILNRLDRIEKAVDQIRERGKHGS